jgi:hypothetical protein
MQKQLVIDSEGFDSDVAPLVNALAQLLGAAETRRELFEFAPVVGSKAERKRAQQSRYVGAWGSVPLTDARYWADSLALASEAHIKSVLDLVALNRAVPFSNEVLARSALEVMARAEWIVDPFIDERMRVRVVCKICLTVRKRQASFRKK